METKEENKALIKKWSKFGLVDGRKPRNLAKKFVSYLEEINQTKTLKIVDIGRNEGTEAKFYSNEGFKVTAMHWAYESVDVTTKLFEKYPEITVKTDTNVPSCDVVSSVLCLPFMPRARFNHFWKYHIVPSIKPGGYFVGHFFGSQHGWNNSTYSQNMTFLTAQEVKSLFDPKTTSFQGFINIGEFQGFKETSKNVPVKMGGTTNWHSFSIIAQKRKDQQKDQTENNSSVSDCKLV